MTVDRWDGLVAVGILAAATGAAMVDAWLVLMLAGILAVAVGCAKAR